MIKLLTALTLILILLLNCQTNRKSAKGTTSSFFLVTAQTETKPVPRKAEEDAADDPAIWINFSQPDSSRIIGTDKKGGLAVYDLSGREIFYYNTGLMNNVDLRYKFPLASDTVDIMAVSNRTDQSIDLYQINHDGSLQVIHRKQLISKMTEEVYGMCMYQSKTNGTFYVFVNSKNGEVEQWELFADKDKIDGRIVRNLKLKTQVEGMVADDATGYLFVGEEDTGIWRFDAEPTASGNGVLLDMISEKDNINIKFDIEGLAIYNLPSGDGYLIASSQGNDSYALFERKSPQKYLGSFKIVKGIISDGTEETDGLDVTNFPLGDKFPNGLLVVQDGHNDDSGTVVPQNFKFVRWDSIAVKFNPPLIY